MSSQNTEQHFIKTFNSMARHQHRYQVFRDFVVLSAISLHNSVAKNDTLEAEYMEVIGKYSKEEAQKMAELLGCLIDLLEPKPTDVLGQLYMTLELGNTNHVSAEEMEMAWQYAKKRHPEIKINS